LNVIDRMSITELSATIHSVMVSAPTSEGVRGMGTKIGAALWLGTRTGPNL
jgi:hypothetical protein